MERVVYDNVVLNPFMKITNIRNSLLPNVSNFTIKAGNFPGEHFVRQEIGTRTITIDVELIANNISERERVTQAVAGAIYKEEPKFLKIGDKMYKAIIDGSTQMENIQFDRQISLNFICYDPIAYGKKRTVTASNRSVLNNGGNYKTRGKIYTYATSNEVSIRLIGGNSFDYIKIKNAKIGQRITIDLLNEHTILGNSAYYIDPLGDYFDIPAGNFSLEIKGGSDTVIEYYERWL